MMATLPNDPTPATAGALFEVYQLLSDKIDERHKSLRATIESGLERYEQQMREHQRENQLVADRVLKMETERLAEARELSIEKARVLHQTDVRVGVFSLLVSSAVSVVLWVLTKVFK